MTAVTGALGKLGLVGLDELAARGEPLPGPPVVGQVLGTCRLCAGGCGLLARVVDGHVIKLEGNPYHPNNQGRLCPKGQAGLQVLYDPQLGRTSMWFDGGMGIIRDGGGYTETHLIRVVAVDAAGNETESDPVRVYVIHKKKKEDDQAAVPHGALIWPVRSEDQQPLPPGTHEDDRASTQVRIDALLPVGWDISKPRNTSNRTWRERY